MTTERAEPVLSVVVVTFNSAEVVLHALDALTGIADLEIVVVDNASTDATVDVVRTALPSATVIENDENVGFARAVNEGVRRSNGELVMLLNPDAEIGAPGIRLLRDALRSHPADVVAPFVEQPAPQRIVSAGRMPTTWRMFTHYFGLSRLSARLPFLEGHYLLPRQVHQTMAVEWVTGACLAIARRTWDQMGGLSERWFMYAEDIEFCYRVRRSGHQVWLVPGARASHLVGQSDSTGSTTVNAAWVVNLRDFYATDLASSRSAVTLWTAVVASGLGVRGLVAAARRGPGSPAARRFRAYSRALVRSNP
jgi:N-acetylglucosaminyl-diphospho-decaprenol L-rhamnosyltransferase